MSRYAVAIRHVHFEDLGLFAPLLHEAGYALRYHDIGVDDLSRLSEAKVDLLIVLGGPIGVYDVRHYPFLAEETALLEARLAADRPTLGLCLGAQLMASALGAGVGPTGIKEIGFGALTLTDEGAASPLRHLQGIPVLHWHGDMFDIPEGAARLAETKACRNQAFAIGSNILGLQFHAEAEVMAGFDRWLIGHACELSGAGIDPGTLRGDAERHGPALRAAGEAMVREWLAGLRA